MKRFTTKERTRLLKLQARLLEFTERPGVLRLLQPGEDVSRAQGLNFNCPVCKQNLTVLFQGKAPEGAKPDGRWSVKHFPSQVSLLSFHEWVGHVCGMAGYIEEGWLLWRVIS